MKKELSLTEKINLLNKIIRGIKSYIKNYSGSYFICHYLEDKKIIKGSDSRLIQPVFPELYEVITKAQKRRKDQLIDALGCFLPHPEKVIFYYEIGAWTHNKERLEAMQELKKKIQQ